MFLIKFEIFIENLLQPEMMFMKFTEFPSVLMFFSSFLFLFFHLCFVVHLVHIEKVQEVEKMRVNQ